MSVQVLTQEMLQNLGSKVGQSISGVTLLRDYSVQLTKNGKEYIVGTIMSGVSVQFKAWGSSEAFIALKNGDFHNIPAYIVADVDNYMDSLSLVIKTVSKAESFTVDAFLPVKYNAQSYWEALIDKSKSSVSEKAYEFLNAILFSNDEINRKFQLEFAASSHHDNCKSGLLAHTYKALLLMQNVIKMYPSIVTVDDVVDQDLVDLLCVGIVLHDVGKVVELNLGVYQPESCVTHNYLGTEFIAKYKDAIIEKYSSDWYYSLISIILQHHGEFGMPCKTVWAYAVHLVDVFDSSMTLLSQRMDEATSDKVRIDNMFLQM